MPESIAKAGKKVVKDLGEQIGNAGRDIITKPAENVVKRTVIDPARRAYQGVVADPIKKGLSGLDPKNAKDQPEAPPIPVIEPPTRMSTSGDKEAAKKRSIAEQRRRKGRASTILTDDPLGG